MPNPKSIKCKNCRTRIEPKGNSSLNQYCEREDCQNARISKALEKGRQSIKRAVKDANKEWNDYRKKVSPVIYSKKYKQELQNAVNKLARMIDARFGFTTCIDCYKGFGAQADAAHFTSIGSNSSLRYNLHNLHSANSGCNQFSDTHHTGYIAGLENRYGKEYLEMVENLPLKYPKIKLSEVEVVEKLKIVRKLIRDFDKSIFSSAVQARNQLNLLIGIYQ